MKSSVAWKNWFSAECFFIVTFQGLVSNSTSAFHSSICINFGLNSELNLCLQLCFICSLIICTLNSSFFYISLYLLVSLILDSSRLFETTNHNVSPHSNDFQTICSTISFSVINCVVLYYSVLASTSDLYKNFVQIFSL